MTYHNIIRTKNYMGDINIIHIVNYADSWYYLGLNSLSLANKFLKTPTPQFNGWFLSSHSNKLVSYPAKEDLTW